MLALATGEEQRCATFYVSVAHAETILVDFCEHGLWKSSAQCQSQKCEKSY